MKIKKILENTVSSNTSFYIFIFASYIFDFGRILSKGIFYLEG